MSPPAYPRYLRITLAKMRTRLGRRRTTVKRARGR